jgi:hypothetical protein
MLRSQSPFSSAHHYALIQRCQAHLPQKHWPELSRQMILACHETDYEEALKRLKLTARLAPKTSSTA